MSLKHQWLSCQISIQLTWRVFCCGLLLKTAYCSLRKGIRFWPFQLHEWESAFQNQSRKPAKQVELPLVKSSCAKTHKQHKAEFWQHESGILLLPLVFVRTGTGESVRMLANSLRWLNSAGFDKGFHFTCQHSNLNLGDKSSLLLVNSVLQKWTLDVEVSPHNSTWIGISFQFSPF